MSASSQFSAARIRLGVIVPARNEALVIERKLRNLARARWPAGEHRLVVVDDESEDGTGERARRLCMELFAAPRADGARIDARVVANDVHPGKAGAIARGLGELGDAADVAVLTDADVLIDGEALPALVQAFELDPGLGLACGAQVFVLALAADGSWPDEPLARRASAAGLYDRITARVRRLESRWGALFSVHGQLLAWRLALGLSPTAGIAADDIDLMVQARRRGARVRLLPGARFFEQKAAPGRAREEQALRRARAYVQVVRAHSRPFRGSRLGELQWAFYRYAPLWSPALIWIAWLWIALAVLVQSSERRAAWSLALLAAAALWILHPTARRLRSLLRVIARAAKLEHGSPQGDRWEMRRA